MLPSQIFFALSLSFIIGTALASFFNLPSFIAGEFFLLGLFYLLISFLFSFKKKRLLTFALCLLALGLGIFHYQNNLFDFENNQLSDFFETEEPIDIILTVSQEPDIRIDKINLTCSLEKVIYQKEVFSLAEKVLIVSRRYPEYHYGDRLMVSGIIEEPYSGGDFNYKNYLRKEGIVGLVYYPNINRLSSQRKSIWQNCYSYLLDIKDSLRKIINQYISPPESYILGAVLLGDKSQIPDDWKEKLNQTGLRHITAISGMHIVILSSILVSLFLSLGFWRGQAFYLTVLIISIYILMIGLPASALRASIMVFLFLLAQKLGRLSFSYRTVIFAALIMLIANPFLLKDDIGFQLSFLAVFGIITFSSFFEEQLKSLFRGNFSGIISIIALTLSAQVFTLPLLIYNFGYFSLVGPITNILIVPCLSYLIILSLIFFLAAFIYPLLGLIFSWLVYLLLSYFVFIISLFNKLPLATLKVSLSWHWLCLFYCFLLFFIWKKRKIRN